MVWVYLGNFIPSVRGVFQSCPNKESSGVLWPQPFPLLYTAAFLPLSSSECLGLGASLLLGDLGLGWLGILFSNTVNLCYLNRPPQLERTNITQQQFAPLRLLI